MNKLSLPEIQKSSFEVLVDVARFCEENNIKYFLMYGTLLGAVRHGGFIPWDDDVDIMMHREDYERFLRAFPASYSGELKLKIFNRDVVDDYPYMISRVSNTNYVINTQNEKDVGMGTFIDIYPLDYVGESELLVKCVGAYYGVLSSLFYLKTRISAPKSSNKKIKSILKKILSGILSLVKTDSLRKMFFEEKLRSRIGKKGRYYAPLVWMTSQYKRNIFTSFKVESLRKESFEGVDFFVPVESKLLLSEYYGDFMSLPPEKDRVPHHEYNAYRKGTEK